MITGERIRKRRRDLNISQEALGTLVDVHANTIRKWEQGIRSPDIRDMNKLAEALDTTIAYLSGETENPERVFVSDAKAGEKLLTLAEKYGDIETDLTSPITAGISDNAYVISIQGVKYCIPKDEDGRKLFLSILQANLKSMGIKVLIPGVQENDNNISQHINVNQHDIGRDATVKIDPKPIEATA